jgi:TolA-binding protein
MKITLLCAVILSMTALALAETAVVENPAYAEESAPQIAESPTPVTDLSEPAIDPATQRDYLQKAIEALQGEVDALQMPVPGETDQEALLRTEQSELKLKKINKLYLQMMAIQ